jgi:hypothetical protein
MDDPHRATDCKLIGTEVHLLEPARQLRLFQCVLNVWPSARPDPQSYHDSID